MTVFHYALKRSGFLFLGKSESLSAHADLFAFQDRKYKIYSPKPHSIRPLASLVPADYRKAEAAESANPQPPFDLQKATDATIVSCDAAKTEDMEKVFVIADAMDAPLEVAIYNPSARVRGAITDLDPEAVTQLQLSPIVDDGAVFYLNGVEVGRVGMLPGHGALAPACRTPAEAGDFEVWGQADTRVRGRESV